MSDTEDRLATMELAISNMQKTIESINKETDHTLSDSINALTSQLATLTSIQHTTQPKYTRGSYEPWGEEQQVLLTHKYVAREVLANVLWRALRAVDNFFTGWLAINNLLDTMPSNSISRSTRFPPHGLYINVNNFDVYNLIQGLREHGYRASAKASQGGNTAKFKEVLSQLQTLAMANVGSGRTVGMIHDRSSFEEEYKLTWVVSSDKSEVSDEVTVTGLSTPV